jgi:hypothetical protein
MKPRRKRFNKVFLALLVLALFGLGAATLVTALLVRSGLPGNVDFYLHQRRYERIVAMSKGFPLAVGAETQTTLDGLKVDVARNTSGTYTITITTVDWHHAGVYGYVFSDAPLSPHPNSNYPNEQSVDNPGDLPFVNKSILGQNNRWWSVYNNLN